MRSGDHICVDRGTFMDHGIYISQEEVIHFNGGRHDSRDSFICNTTLDEFAPGGWNSWVGVIDHRGHHHFSYTEVIERAKSKLGKHGYDLNDPNCEHFATWCATGESFSSQPHTKGRDF
jgi:Lecithin retinol acyltransferase